jgi:hypothetical protein
MKWVTLQPDSPNSKYEPYREAWHLLREAIAAQEETKDDTNEVEEQPADAGGIPRNMLERMEASFRFVKGRLET